MLLPDVYTYMVLTLQFLDGFAATGIADIPFALEELSHLGRPPLYQLLTLPFLLVFGHSESAFLSVNLPFLALLVISTYQIGRLVGGGWVGVVAAIVVAAYPPITNLSHVYLPHFALVGCTAFSLWLVLRMVGKRTVTSAWWACFSLAFGLLIHPLFAWFALVAAGLAFYAVLFTNKPTRPAALRSGAPWMLEKLRDRFVLCGLLPGSIGAAALVAPWYLVVGHKLLHAQKSLLSSSLADFRGYDAVGIGFPEVEPSFWWYAVTAPGALSNVLAAFALVGFVIGLLRGHASTRAVAITLGTGYILLSVRTWHAWWYFAPALPAAAVLTAAWPLALRQRWLTRLLWGICIAVSVYVHVVGNMGLPQGSHTLAVALGSPLDTETCSDPSTVAFCPRTPSQATWPTREVIETILEDPDFRIGNAGSIVFDACGFPALTRYCLARYFPSVDLKHSYPFNNILGSGYPLSSLLRSDFLFTFDHGLPPPSQTTNYLAATSRFLHSPPSAFSSTHRTVATFDSPGTASVRLIKRITPLTVAEAASSIASLDLLEKYKSERYQLLIPLYAAEGDSERALDLYREAIGAESDPEARADLDHHIAAFLPIGDNPAFIEKVLAIHPENFPAHLALARIYRVQGKDIRALPHFEMAVSLRPSIARLQRELAATYRSLGKDRQAIAAYEKCLAIDPEDDLARDALLELRR